ncbi:MAG: STAS domain-containing protein [Bacteroidales bacterium]|nr:STAS domain-containing protein [Bacteroidales bacterium]
MNTTLIMSGDYSVIIVEGRVDTTNAGEFEKEVMAVVESGTEKIILDCSGLKYISSSGLRVFLIVHKKMLAKKGCLKLCSLQPGIKEIFDISGFSSIFSIFPDKQAAERD